MNRGTETIPKLSKLSLSRLYTCDPRLVQLVLEAIKTTPIDFMVVCGARSKADQDKAVAEGKSKTPWPKSRHNRTPSEAVDLCPMIQGKLDWSRSKLQLLAKHILSEATRLGIPVRWGGDFNQNGVIGDDTFIDMPHFELTTKKDK